MPPDRRWWVVARRLLPLVAVLIFAFVAYLVAGDKGISLESLVRHRAIIDAFVSQHRVMSVVAFVGIYIVTVAFSLPGATFLTVAGGFLFGLVTGASAAAVGATVGATLIFLVARTALGEPLLRRAGPRARQLAKGFREDAFSYLLFLRLVPVFPFFLVNLVPAFAGVRLGPFVAATVIGVIPAVLVFTLAGMGLDSVITAQKNSFYQCIAAGEYNCQMIFDPADVFTPQLIAALVGFGLLALVPVVVKRWRARSRAAT
ncbi:MAG: TVP38/TMEM64 family protein [Sphingobacteriales bacterium]